MNNDNSSELTKKDIKGIIIRNKALLSVDEGFFLYNLAKKTKGDIVEIGSFLGGSTIILAKGLRKPYRVFAIDPHTYWSNEIRKIGNYNAPKNVSEIFKNNIEKAGISDRIVFIKKTSEEAVKDWKKKISLLWIDGDHEYKEVKKDFLLWGPYLTKKKVIAFHDSFYNDLIFKKKLLVTGYPHCKLDGPGRIVKEYIYDSKRFKIINIVDTITAAVKIKKTGIIEKLKNKIELYKLNNSNSLFLLDSLKIEKKIGLFGIFLKNKYPKLYFFLKRIKKIKKGIKNNVKIAIFHNFMDNIGGAEYVDLILARELNADIYTTNIDKEKIKKMGFSTENIYSIGKIPINPPFKQEFAYWKFRRLNVEKHFKKKYDFYIIAGDWAMSGAIHNKPHLWYVYSPTREIWDLYEYTRKNIVSFWKRPFFDIWVFFRRIINKYDVKYVKNIISISENVKKRVKKYLNKDSIIIYPPTETFNYKYNKSKGYWLSVNRLINQKRVDMQMKAFSKLSDEKLIIVGSYEQSEHFKKYADYVKKIKPENVEIKSWINQEEIIDLYSNCKGFITTMKDEDFGLTPIEAMASGKPVIAPNEGGYKETIVNGKTGILIDDINEYKLIEAIKILGKEIDKNPLKFKKTCQKQARKFDTKVFIKKIKNIIEINNLDYLSLKNKIKKYTKICNEYAKKFKVIPEIHPKDFIFHFVINNQNSKIKNCAVEYYFHDGSKSAEKLSLIINNLYKNQEKGIKLLEFASGYGCVTRHLPNYLKNASITCCDIHNEAINFINDKIGIPAIISNSKPEKLVIPHDYDVIFALSFFSHMPITTWERWLKVLISKLKKDGYLIFTTHGMESIRKYASNIHLDSNGFFFAPSSEQKDLNSNDYGTTYVTKKFVESQISKENNVKLFFYKKAFWWEHQDLYIIKKIKEEIYKNET